MTYASDMGLKVGDRVFVSGWEEEDGDNCGLSDGDILVFLHDDGREIPMFRREDGKHVLGVAEFCLRLKFVRKLEPEA